VCRFVVVLLFMGLLPSVAGRGVLAAQRDPQFGPRRNQQSAEEEQREREQVRARAKERYEKLKQDTDKLLQLSTELKQYVDKANENVLSLDVIKKTDEIEKLAKSVREKMKTYEAPPEQGGFPPR